MWSIFIDNFSLFLTGIENTIILTLGSAFFGIILAVILTAIKMSKSKLFNSMVHFYLFIVRGTPFLLQLFIIYYGIMQFDFIAHTFLATFFKSAMNCALLALTINTSAYTTGLFMGAIENFPKLEMMAAKSLGMSKMNIYKKIILPQIFMKTLPIYGNELIMLMKCSAIVSSITIMDVMGATQQVMAMTYENLPCLIIAALLYLLMTAIIILPLKLKFNSYCRKTGFS
jgi:His/Glu/Gln/Arg/opine family amino acid ABC transporter permease subunit